MSVKFYLTSERDSENAVERNSARVVFTNLLESDGSGVEAAREDLIAAFKEVWATDIVTCIAAHEIGP